MASEGWTSHLAVSGGGYLQREFISEKGRDAGFASEDFFLQDISTEMTGLMFVAEADLRLFALICRLYVCVFTPLFYFIFFLFCSGLFHFFLNQELSVCQFKPKMIKYTHYS